MIKPYFYLIVGVDQEGDSVWSLQRNRTDAVASAQEMSECAFDSCIKLYIVDGSTLAEEEIAKDEW